MSTPGPGAPPAAGPRTVPAVAVVVGLVVLVVLGVAALVVLPRLGDDDGGGATGLTDGDGPRSEPAEEWTVELGREVDEEDVGLVADRERAYVVVMEEEEQDDDDGFAPPAVTATIVAYDLDDGAELWTIEAETASLGADVLSPAGDDRLLLSAEDDGDDVVRLLDAETGDELWEVDGQVAWSYSNDLRGPARLREADTVLVRSRDDLDVITHAAVDIDTGDELWDAEADGATACTERLALVVGPSPSDDASEPEDREVQAVDLRTGEDRWTTEGTGASCDDARAAVPTVDGEVRVLRLGSGDEVVTVDVGTTGPEPYAQLDGEHLVVTGVVTDDDGGSSRLAAHRLSDGEETWSESGVFGFVLGNGNVLASPSSDPDEGRLLRTSDGEELGTADVPGGGDGGCEGDLTSVSVLTCEGGSGEVRSLSLEDLDEEWSVDVGTDLVAVTAGGARLLALTEDGELVSLR